MKKNWHEFYKQRINQSYLYHFEKRYKPFLMEIMEEITDNTAMLEAGCGMSNSTRLLLEKGGLEKQVTYLEVNDICPHMLGLSLINLEFFKNINFQLRDIKEIPSKKFNIIHSHGVLEHFNNDEINQIVKNQLSYSDVLIHYVPSAKYSKPSFGDERLLTPNEWYEICQPDQIIEFNNGYDLILKWKTV